VLALRPEENASVLDRRARRCFVTPREARGETRGFLRGYAAVSAGKQEEFVISAIVIVERHRLAGDRELCP